MLFHQLTISYECLSSIGNSLELESMMAEIIITFSRKTGAVTGSYFKNYEESIPLINIGKKIPFSLLEKNININKEYYIFHEADKQVVVLPFKTSYAVFIYKGKQEVVRKLASMLGNFQHKINLSISACEGVKNLEELNEGLEQRVQKSIEKIHNNEKVLIAQSKQAIMGEMIEMIAHQWRQPITTIGMIANNILFDIALDEFETHEISDELNKVNLQVSYLSKTIDDFRDFFKESKEKQSIVIQEVFDGTLAIIEKHLLKQDIEIIIDNKVKNLKFMTFQNELIQVFLNILGNAKDAFENKRIENKKIIIKAKQEKNILSITISDNAGGIKVGVIERIFEPYFSTKKKKNGTGLGLYMSMIIMSEHLGGDIKVKNIDSGAEFEILIPLEGDRDD